MNDEINPENSNGFQRKYAIDILREILTQEQAETVDEIARRSKLTKLLEKKGCWKFIQTIYAILIKLFPDFLTFIETKIFLKRFHQKISVNPLSEYYCRDFLLYVLKKNPEIPYFLYNKIEDQRKINAFIKSKFLAAWHRQINSEAVPAKKNKHQSIKQGKYYTFMGFKSVVNHFCDTVFLERYGLDTIKHFPKNSTILDCGAYIGDTAFIFKQILKPKTIVAVEPDKENYNYLLQNINLNTMKNIIPINAAISDRVGKGSLNFAGTPGAQLISAQKTEGKVRLDTVDHLVSRLNLKNIKLIKMDIEGSELAALKGAIKTIQHHKPVLIISLYHRGQDFFEIPPLLKRLNPEYKMRFLSLDPKSPINEYILIAQ